MLLLDYIIVLAQEVMDKKKISLQLQIVFYLFLYCFSVATTIIDERSPQLSMFPINSSCARTQTTFVQQVTCFQISWCNFSDVGGC